MDQERKGGQGSRGAPDSGLYKEGWAGYDEDQGEACHPRSRLRLCLPMRAKVFSLSLAYLGLVLLGSGGMVSYLSVPVGGPAGGPVVGLEDGDGIYEVTFYPPNPQPGGNITFDVGYRGFDQSRPRIMISWTELNGSHRESAERSPGDCWQIPEEIGILAYMAYIQEGNSTNYTVAFSSMGVLAVPGDVRVVENSSLVQVWVAESDMGDDVPFPIVVQVAMNAGLPAVTILSIQYQLFTGPSTGGGSGGWFGLREGFEVNESENDEWITYVVEPQDFYWWPENVVPTYVPPESGVVCVWVVGQDSDGAIHFAKPLFYHCTDIPEHLPHMEWEGESNHTRAVEIGQ